MATQDTIDRVLAFDSDGLPVVSLYRRVGPDGAATPLSSLLAPVRPLATDPSLRGDLTRIAAAAGAEPPGTTAYFSCSGRGFYAEVWLPRAVRDRVRVNHNPWVHPMLAVLEEFPRVAAAVVDQGHVRYWELGESSARELDSSLDKLFDCQGFDALVAGGRPDEVASFAGHLPEVPGQRLAGTFTVDPANATAAEISLAAAPVLRRHRRDQDRRLAREITRNAATGGPATVGLPDTVRAVRAAATHKLAVRGDVVVPGVVCDRDGWFGLITARCPLCGAPVRDVGNVLEELAEAAIDEGSSVTRLFAGAGLGPHAAGALLRRPY